MGAHGFFTIRLKYLKSKRCEPNTENTPRTEQVSTEMGNLNLSPNEDLEFLKTCVVKNTDLSVLVRKLKCTQKLRENMMRDENIDLRTSFPFFFAEPNLVKIFYISALNTVLTTISIIK